ncbi:MAG: S-adenosylmethionine synthetase N-terminal domain-containing protein [Oscillospiraceae bacterium]|nr:S-adenosylmethionine synthetase N-terminal domain-containing protein [Oscillospiraceae bacterium]
MIEKVNPAHPDKVADRIAGAIVDLAYLTEDNPKIAVEVLLGHGVCHVIIETTATLNEEDIEKAVHRIVGDVFLDLHVVPQDKHLADNQSDGIRCGDNGIFKGVPLTTEQRVMSDIARDIYKVYPTDGKYILDMNRHRLIICQSNADAKELKRKISVPSADVNPLGYWTGGSDVDTGATNRKLGSDMADSVTGGGLHGKDLSKADVSVNIYAFLKAQKTGKPVELCCAIGDTQVDGIPYSEIVEEAREYIRSVGGFEKFAEWGLY